jgi:hypothetical protein
VFRKPSEFLSNWVSAWARCYISEAVSNSVPNFSRELFSNNILLNNRVVNSKRQRTKQMNSNHISNSFYFHFHEIIWSSFRLYSWFEPLEPIKQRGCRSDEEMKMTKKNSPHHKCRRSSFLQGIVLSASQDL